MHDIEAFKATTTNLVIKRYDFTSGNLVHGSPCRTSVGMFSLSVVNFSFSE